MGAWGINNFDNDDAMDWIHDLQESEGDTLLVDSLTAVVNTPKSQYLDAPEGAMALAAAEVVAAARGAPAKDLPEDVRAWVGKQSGLKRPDLKELASRAVERTAFEPNSELKDLWEETEHEQAWQEVVGNLQKRLNQ